jgi:hypothetical protein
MSFENEASATAAAAAEEVNGFDGGTMTEDTTETDGGVSSGFFSTPAPDLVKPKAHKHNGYIKSVRTMTSTQKGTPGIEIVAQSESNGKEYKRTIWVLAQYAANPNLDAETELKGLPAPEGKVQTPFERYGRTIQNSKGTAELQQAVNAGISVGRTFSRYTTFEQLGEVLNTALSGCPCVFKDTARETETGFSIELGDIFPLTDSKGNSWFDKLKVDAADGRN